MMDMDQFWMVDSREIMALSGENDKDPRGLEGIILRQRFNNSRAEVGWLAGKSI